MSPKRWAVHMVCVGILAAALWYYFSYVGNYAAFPWWHQSKNDIDPTYAGTTVGLLNNSELQYIYHPGATVYFFHGLGYRAVALRDPAHQRLFEMTRIRSLDDASSFLELATRTSRVLTVIITIVFVAVFYVFLAALTGRPGLSFAVSFYVATSYAILMHTYMIRPEILSLLFVFLPALLLCHFFRRPHWSFPCWSSMFVSTGFCLGFSILSKIQSAPLVGALVLVVLVALVLRALRSPEMIPEFDRHARLGVIWSSGLLILTPWWAIRRPDYMTPEFIRNLKYTAHEQLMFGLNPPLNFYGLVLAALLAILALHVGLLVLRRVPAAAQMRKRILPPAFFLNGLATGAILSAYAILLPVSGSWDRYIENTRHLIYSIFTNILSAKIMQYKVVDSQTLPKIFAMHGITSPVLSINIWFFLTLALAGSGIRLCRRSTKQRGAYLSVLGLVAIGFIMDFLGTLRGPALYDYYACYSIVFYAAGLAVWIVAEMRQAPVMVSQGWTLQKIFYHAVLLVFFLHGALVVRGFLQAPRPTGASDQSPRQEYINTRSLARPFWRIADESIQRHKAVFEDGGEATNGR